MRECLYHPVHSNYSKAESRRFADYYTSVDVHPIFARLLARQFAEMWESLDHPAEFMLVEAGGGARGFSAPGLGFCGAKIPAFFHSLRSVALGASAPRRGTASVLFKQHTASGPFT